jgi:hypothetical protein
MDEPRFGRLWRRRAFGVSRRTGLKTSIKARTPAKGLKDLAEALRALAGRFGLRIGRRAKIRLVHPEPAHTPVSVEEPAACTVRMDARGLQRMLEAEMRRDLPPRTETQERGEQEPVRRSG